MGEGTGHWLSAITRYGVSEEGCAEKSQGWFGCPSSREIWHIRREHLDTGKKNGKNMEGFNQGATDTSGHDLVYVWGGGLGGGGCVFAEKKISPVHGRCRKRADAKV